MSAKFPIEIKNQKLLESIYKLYGVALVREALESEKCEYPGYGLAQAIADRECANLRAELSGNALREAANAGFNIGKSISVSTTFKDGKPYLEIEMPDLMDAPPGKDG